MRELRQHNLDPTLVGLQILQTLQSLPSFNAINIMTKKDYEAMIGSKDDLLPEHRACRTFVLEGWTSGGPGGQGVCHWQEIARIFSGLRQHIRMWCWARPVYIVERQIISSGRGRKRWEHAITIIILYGISSNDVRRMQKSEVGRARLAGDSERSEEEK